MPLLSDPISAVASIITKLIPDKEAAAEAKAKLLELDQQGEFDIEKAQLQVDQAEASSGNWFAADWRPFIGWVLGIGLAYGLIFQPFAIFFVTLFHINFNVAQLPVLDRATILELLGGMLGFGALKKFDDGDLK